MKNFKNKKSTFKQIININNVVILMFSIFIYQDAYAQFGYVPWFPQPREITPEEKREIAIQEEQIRRQVVRELIITENIRNALEEDIYENLNPIIQDHFAGQFDLGYPFSFHTPKAIYAIYTTFIAGGAIVFIAAPFVAFVGAETVGVLLGVGGLTSFLLIGYHAMLFSVSKSNEWGSGGYFDRDNRKRFIYTLLDRQTGDYLEKECIIHLKYSGTRSAFKITYELDWCPDLPQNINGELRISEYSRLFDIGQETVVTKGSVDFPYSKPRRVNVFRNQKRNNMLYRYSQTRR